MDQHLFAEFREIKMIPKALNRSLNATIPKKVLSSVPKEFTLNTGHVRFFYDKGKYLKDRYKLIKLELDRRGINYSKESEFDPDKVFDSLSEVFSKDYIPTDKALRIIRDRIQERINQKPGWYRYYGESSNG